MIIRTLILSLLLSTGVLANEYAGVSQRITADFQGKQVLGLLATGIYYRVNSDCTVPPYGTVILVDTGYYGSLSTNYSGGSPSKVHWKEEVTTLDSCTRDCNDEVISNTSTHWHSCDVTGIIGGKPTVVQCEDNSPIYTVDSELLYLQNIKVYDGLDDTLLRFNRAILQHENGCFALQKIE